MLYIDSSRDHYLTIHYYSTSTFYALNSKYWNRCILRCIYEPHDNNRSCNTKLYYEKCTAISSL